MIPAPGEIYQHDDGTQIKITKVEVSRTMEVVRVEFVYGTHLCEANAEGWKTLAPTLTRVPPPPPEPVLPRFRFVERLLPDLKMMQGLEKQFAMGIGDVESGYTEGREVVTVLVARGLMATFLREVGLRIHQEMNKQNGTQNQN